MCFFFFFLFVFFRFFFFFQAEDGIRDLVRSRGLGDVYKRQQGITIVGFIADQPLWELVDKALNDGICDKGDFMRLSLIHI